MRRFSRLVICFILISVVEPSASQDIQWQRRTDGYLEGVKMAVYHGGMEYTKPVFADLDNDGDGDLYVGEHDGYINVFENLGGDPPEWSCVTTALDSIDVGKHAAPTFWDIDTDGDLDLFIGDENDGDIWYYRNDGTPESPIWTFVTDTYIAPSLVDHHAVPFFADLDQDGDDDLLVGHNEGGAAHFLNAGSPGSPAWSFQTMFYAGFDVGDKSAVCVFDVNGDDLKDLFLAGLEGEIHFILNDGPGQNPTYTDLGVIFDVGFNATPTLWDLDGDGDLDLVSGESDGNLNLLTNTGTPTDPRWTFADDQLAYLDLGFRSMPALADIDADGDLDLFVGRLQTGIAYLNNVGSADSAAWRRVSDSYADLDPPGREAPVFYDLDGDGDLDLLVGTEAGTLILLQNTGTPQNAAWSEPVYSYAGIDVGGDAAPAVADVDGDGDGDLFIGNQDGTLHYYRNDGTPSNPVWQDMGEYPGIDVGNYSAPAFQDLDEDGDLDLLVGNGMLTGFIAFYRNLGTPLLPSWTLESSTYQGWDFGDYAVPCPGDLDGDGDADLLVGCEAGGLWFWENEGLLRDATISLLPYDPPIVVPAEGGTFQYVLRLENHEAEPLPVVVWTTITFPDSQVTGAIDSLELVLQPGTNSDLMTQDIPSEWPAGEYHFNGYLGQNSQLIYSSDSFPFEKEDTLGVPEVVSAPGSFFLAGIHPNPFNPVTVIRFYIPQAAKVTLEVFDVSGRRAGNGFVPTRRYTPGTHQITFDGSGLPSGVYIYRLTAGEFTASGKMVLLK